MGSKFTGITLLSADCSDRKKTVPGSVHSPRRLNVFLVTAGSNQQSWARIIQKESKGGRLIE